MSRDGMGRAYGRPFVSGDRPGVSYTHARCADYLEYEPRAATCERATTLHHFGETVGYRIDAGALASSCSPGTGTSGAASDPAGCCRSGYRADRDGVLRYCCVRSSGPERPVALERFDSRSGRSA